jgi:hypothetical protein
VGVSKSSLTVRDWYVGFYEKVVKVKADVAAILNSRPQIEADHHDAASRWCPRAVFGDN